MPDKRFRNVSWIWAILVAIFFSWLTRAGLVITHDSLFYLEGADHLRAGQGFLNYFWGNLAPDTHYGPLYPAFIAAISWLSGLSATQAAFLGMTLLVVVNIRLFAALLQKFTLPAIYRYALLFVLPFSTPFWLVHTHLWSEALYLSFFLWGLHITLGSLAPRRWYVIGLIMGFSVLVRFSGLFMLPLFGIWILLEKESKWYKFRHFITYCCLALLPFILWTLRNQYVGNELSSRELFWAYAGNYSWLEVAHTLLFWLGWSIPLLLGLVLGSRLLQHNRILGLWVVYPVIYAGLLVLAKSTIDRQIPLDTRLLSGILPVCLLVSATLWSYVPAKNWHKAIWLLAVLLNLLQFMRPAGQLFKQELGLYPSVVKPYLASQDALVPPLHATDTLFCREFDFNYLKRYSRQPIVYAHNLPKQPFYFARITAALPQEFSSGAWQVDTLITDRLYYATPAYHP